MKAPHVLPGSRRFPAGPGRIALFGLGTSLLYALGLTAGGYAGWLSLESVRGGREVAVLPWVAAFVFMVSGMLAVVYGFFFRPRAVEFNEEEVALIQWDGKGRSLRRDQVTSVEPSAGRLVLRAGAESLVIPRIFSRWPDLTAQLAAWAPQGR